jgi:tetratricopeptide (TPR) repeat protein
MEKLAEEGVKIPGVLGDDISGLYQNLASHYRLEKDEEAATRTATAWLDYLKKQIAGASNAEARIGYDLHMVSAATFLRKPELALPEVERAERELRSDYNPPRVAASLYQQMGRLDDALAAYDRALQKSYGAPKLNLYLTKGRLLERKGESRRREEGLRRRHRIRGHAPLRYVEGRVGRVAEGGGCSRKAAIGVVSSPTPQKSRQKKGRTVAHHPARPFAKGTKSEEAPQRPRGFEALTRGSSR